jgi:plasmid stabilization system protein ParE
MSLPSLEIHPRAALEAREARRWYARRSVAVANRFISELDHAIAQITAAPQQWSPYLHGTRVYRLRRYPFLVVYESSAVLVRVIAVAHARRRPGYWRRRLP